MDYNEAREIIKNLPDEGEFALRMLLINYPDVREGDYPDEYDMTYAGMKELRLIELVEYLRGESKDYGMSRELATEIALSQSLCPVHFVDYAICFDDNDLRCSEVREVHPLHDT
jgi:hypothetical protein